MDEPPQKRQKTEDDASEIIDFLKEENEDIITMLRIILEELNVGLSHTSVYFLLVEAANSNSYAKFSSATVTAEFILKEDGKRLVAPFALFFARGFGVLSDFLDKEDPKIPENMDERRALLALVQFLTNEKEQSVLCNTKKESEAALALRLAQHLLIPLVPQKSFIIDSYPGLPSERCCSAKHPMNGTKGDTSYGCPKGWHGRVDVLLKDSEVALSVVEAAGDEGNSDAASVMSDSSVEVKKGDKFSMDSISQVIAQTIVFSFIQHKRNPVLSNSMVPGIGICSKKLVVYMYDCVEDILLTSGPVDIHVDISPSGLNYRAIIILWLALNYKLFGNATPPKYKHCISKFHNILGPKQLEMYKEQSEQPFKGKIVEEDFYKLFSEGKETAGPRDKVAEYVPERKSISVKSLRTKTEGLC